MNLLEEKKWMAIAVALIAIADVAAAQTYQRYLSDRVWTSTKNGRGPVERDRNNGGPGLGDGGMMLLKGTVYGKGLGVYGNSEIRYNLRGICSALTSDIGLDDQVNERGSVVFQVWADGEKLYESGVITGTSAVETVAVDVTGRQELVIVTTDAGDGSEFDLANWGNPTLTCDRAGKTTAPIVIDGERDVTISGVNITNDDGPCIIIKKSSENIRIENSELGPCGGGMLIESSNNITVDNVYIYDTGQAGNGIDVTFSQNVTITNNSMERVRSGVYVLRSTGVKVDRNNFLNVQGPLPRGQFVQFNHVYGRGNRIYCNVGENVLGSSDVVEAINIYDSFGEADDPIEVVGNKIQGGGPSESSGAILVGDGGGSYQVVRDNVIAEPGQQGIGIAGGNDITVSNNNILARQRPFTNVGLYVWNQDISRCFNITVQGNNVNWTNRDGKKNPFWNAENCGTVNGLGSNNWDFTDEANTLEKPIAACSLQESLRGFQGSRARIETRE